LESHPRWYDQILKSWALNVSGKERKILALVVRNAVEKLSLYTSATTGRHGADMNAVSVAIGLQYTLSRTSRRKREMTIRNEQPGIKEKLRQLKLANDAYARGFPFLSEDEYHKLWREIAKEDPHNPELYHTARDPNRANTVPHLFHIMGTQKAFELDDMRPFLQRFKDKQLIIEPKYDGLAAILYAGEPGRQPRLIKAGDGSYGEDISHHLPYIAVDHLDFLQ